MRVEKGIPRDFPKYNDTPSAGGVVSKTDGAGEGIRKHGAGLMDKEACDDEDEDEDD